MPYMLMKRDGLAGISYYKTGVGPSHRWKKRRGEATTYSGEDFARRDLVNSFTREERQRIEVIELPEEAEKKYLAFCSDSYYPAGGWDDLLGEFSSIPAAIDAAQELSRTKGADWAQIILVNDDLSFERIIDGELKNIRPSPPQFVRRSRWEWKEAK